MTNQAIRATVEAHNLRVEEKNGRIFGFIPWRNVLDGSTGEDKTDLTGVNRKQLLFWLGY